MNLTRLRIVILFIVLAFVTSIAYAEEPANTEEPINLAGAADRYYYDGDGEFADPFLIDGSRRMEDPHIQRNVDTSYLELAGGTNPVGGGAALILFGNDHPLIPGGFAFYVPNADRNAPVVAFAVSGDTDDPVVDFNGHRVGNVMDPILPQDLATKAYIESYVQDYVRSYVSEHCTCQGGLK